MVMTLRKRVPSISPLSESESEIETPQKKKKTPNPTKRREISDSESEFDSNSEEENEDAAEYERIREERIRENRERMEKLGIFSLSSGIFNSKKTGKVRRKNPPQKKKRYPPLYPRPRSYDPSRRSARLKDVSKAKCLENERALIDMGITIPDAWKPEFYTEEHEKLLGDCEVKWTMNMDGFGEDGERLYNPDGQPCHQCRQKTLGKLTYCGKCRSAQGHLCGDCLYTRYGENVLEAVQNPTWLCPACRDICNCSRCRRSKGWQPINIPHSKIVATGFKSVAHYLILTRRAGTAPKALNDEIVTVDLTAEETTAPQENEGSDYSAESSESDSDDSDNEDDSKGGKNYKEQSIEEQVGPAEVSNEIAAATAADGVQVLSSQCVQFFNQQDLKLNIID